MAKLVFDIETSALPIESFDTAQQEFLFREAEKLADPEDRATRRCEIQRMLSLWPLTARILCIAMVNANTALSEYNYNQNCNNRKRYADDGGARSKVVSRLSN